MNATHTPGPWTFDRMLLGPNVKDRRSGFVVNAPEDSEGWTPRICDLRCGYGHFAEVQANARLIASAPELLAALSELLDQLTSIGIPEWAGAEGLDLTQARAAITNATGDAPAEVDFASLDTMSLALLETHGNTAAVRNEARSELEIRKSEQV